jgi:hypothetical protein
MSNKRDLIDISERGNPQNVYNTYSFIKNPKGGLFESDIILRSPAYQLHHSSVNQLIYIHRVIERNL